MLNARYCPWLILGGVGVLLLILWVAGMGAIGAAPAAPPGGMEKSAYVASDHRREKHFVTPRQLADSNAMVSRVVDGLEATGHDGRRRRWAEISGGQPVVVVFIKDGCPCSAEFEPFFRRVAALYRDQVRFVGVIDASLKAARQYAAEQHVSYPILADPDRRIIRRLNARHGGYVALLTTEGVIDGFWPGCTAATMRELGRGIARLAGVVERPLDVTGMPGPLTTGCPFEF
jgi:peroxiredoxin